MDRHHDEPGADGVSSGREAVLTEGDAGMGFFVLMAIIASAAAALLALDEGVDPIAAGPIDATTIDAARPAAATQRAHGL
jgi:hypothetical protein